MGQSIQSLFWPKKIRVDQSWFKQPMTDQINLVHWLNHEKLQQLIPPPPLQVEKLFLNILNNNTG